MNSKITIQVLAAAAGFSVGYYLDWGNIKVAHEPSPDSVLPISITVAPMKKTVLKQSFYWQQLESTNFFEFVRNLHNIQCPDLTVCDLIKAELDKIFSARWRKEHAAAGAVQGTGYWIPRPPRWLMLRRDKEDTQKFESEKLAMLRKLLGVNGGRCACERADTIFPRIALLSGEKQASVDSILEHYKGLESDLEDEALLGDMNPDSSNRWISLIEEKRKALLTVLSPAELNRLELSLSPIARYVRERLFGFQPSEQEFQAAYAFEKGLGQIRLGFGSSPEFQEAVTAERKALDAALKEALGADRFAEYQLLSNPQYRLLSDVGRSLQWDSETIQSASHLFRQYAILEQQTRENRVSDDLMYKELFKLSNERTEKLRSILGETRFGELATKRKQFGFQMPPRFQFW